MTLQTSGTISLTDIAGEFGGSVPHGLNEYYKGGGSVPSTVGNAAGSYTAYVTGSSGYWVVEYGSIGIISWAGSNVTTSAGSGFTHSTGGYDYQRSGNYYASANPSKYGGPQTFYYSVRRRTSSSTTTVNTNIPTSGQISFGNFYGGRAS